MAFKIADAFVEVHARTDNMDVHVKKAVRKLESDVGSDAEKAGSGIGRKFMSGFLKDLRPSGSVKTFIGTFAGITAAALAATPAVISAGKWIGELGKAAGSASPALLALAAGGTFVALTMKQIGPAIGESLLPISEGFTKAGTAAGRLAADGIRPLAADFVRLNMPNIAAGMNRIAMNTNTIVISVLRWANSTAGVRAFRNVVDATGAAFGRITPPLIMFLTALGDMIGRIAGVSLAAGSNGLAGVLGNLTERMNGVTEATVRNGLDELKEKYHQVKDAISTVIEWVRQAIDFWTKYRTEIGYVQDGLALLAIAFGGPVVAAAAAVTLIIRHWDELKIAWQGVVDYFNSTPGSKFMDDMRVAGENTAASLMRNWETIRTAIGPVLEEIWDKLINKVIPSFGEFVRAGEPVVSWFRDELGPVVSEEMKGVLDVISGVLDIITGIFQVFTGTLTLDWSKTWEGLKNIGSGGAQILKQIFLAMGGQIVIDMFNKGQQLWRDFTGWVGRLRDDVGNFTNDMRQRAINAVIGLVGSVVIKGQEMSQGFTGWVGRLRDNTVGFVEDMRNRVVGALDSLRDGFWRTVDRIGEGWNRLRDIVRHPVNGVIDIWNNVNNLWNGTDLRHFATGGRVPGSGSGDTVPAMLTPGEFVIRKGIAEPTRRFLEALNAGQAEAVQAAGGMFGRMEKFAEGGPVGNAMAVARSMHGKPYVWGGSGPGGTDCSGFMAYLTRALRMEANPYRRIGTTSTFPWPGFVSGMSSAFAIGNVPGSHMRGTLAGMNVESGGGHGYVAAGPPARGVPYGSNYSLPQAGGQFVGGGEVGGLTKAAIRLALAPVRALIGGLYRGPDLIRSVPRDLLDSAYGFAERKALEAAPEFDRGGLLQPGMQYVRNDTSRPERVLSPDQTSAFERLVDVITTQGGATNNFHVTIDARSVAEMQSVAQFFDRVQQVARATRAPVGRMA